METSVSYQENSNINSNTSFAKVFLSIILIFIIILTFLASFFYISFNLSTSSNRINKNLRKYFLKSSLLRNVFRLRQIGDARFDLATEHNFSSLKLNFYYQQNESLLLETIQNTISEISHVIDKPGAIEFEEQVITNNINSPLTDEELKQLKTNYPAEFDVNESLANVNIYVLKSYGVQPTLAGLVLDDRNIFLFMDPIRSITSIKTSTEFSESSTILHEFAHLLGAEHIDKDSCILSEKVENLAKGIPSYVRDTFCPEDFEEIDRALKI